MLLLSLLCHRVSLRHQQAQTTPPPTLSVVLRHVQGTRVTLDSRRKCVAPNKRLTKAPRESTKHCIKLSPDSSGHAGDHTHTHTHTGSTQTYRHTYTRSGIRGERKRSHRCARRVRTRGGAHCGGVRRGRERRWSGERERAVNGPSCTRHRCTLTALRFAHILIIVSLRHRQALRGASRQHAAEPSRRGLGDARRAAEVSSGSETEPNEGGRLKTPRHPIMNS